MAKQTGVTKVLKIRASKRLLRPKNQEGVVSESVAFPSCIWTGEPDSNAAIEILEILKKLNEDFHKTIIMVTHDPHSASYAHVTRDLEVDRLLSP